ncbi:S8 family serine peptidase [Flexithrix dorotheae]|uniref:S8 family serine peptidase n=1 Tax=Flexithrix dorotheae TaxID=70993 RepID=UPI00037183DC|nr:S8 family serine peptidase [Flexithrix dorotheae]
MQKHNPQMVNIQYSLLALLFLLINQYSVAQQQPVFQLPNDITTKDYMSGKLIVKLKPEYEKFFLRKSINEKTQSVFEKYEIAPQSSVFPSNYIAESKSRKSFGKPTVNPGLFYTLNYKKGENIELVINELYTLGFAELIEPSYIYKTSLEPNDSLISNQYYLENIKAFEAWEITKGDSNVIIGIVDSGIDFNHPDLMEKVFYNPNEIPDNGIDDDNDGYIDNISGWDFAGADTLNPSEDNDAQLIVGGTNAHGVNVAGCAVAATNNNFGMAGVGYNCKFIATKHSFDNQREDDPSVYNAYAGVAFMIAQKVDVMNLSFGGSFRSEILQDLFDLAVLEEDIVVVAAAGNSGDLSLEYPAAYEHVISVAALDKDNKKASFSTSGTTIDLAAPGVGIFTTDFDGKFTTTNGTSFSSPIVAGAAGLIRAHFPDLTAKQVSELLRVTADTSIFDLPENIEGNLGNGLLNIQNALTEKVPGISLINPQIKNSQGSLNIISGDTIVFTSEFINYLWQPEEDIIARVSTSSPFISILNNSFNLGKLGQDEVVSNDSNPFLLLADPDSPDDTTIILELSFNGNGYRDKQFFEVNINPSIINVQENLVSTSVANNGRIGFGDTDQEKGLGFIFEEENFLFEMGLMLGVSENQLSSSVRADTADNELQFHDHFNPVSSLKEFSPGKFSSLDIVGEIDNSLDTSRLGMDLDIKFRAMAYTEPENDQFIIMEYIIKNSSTDSLKDFYAGLFADWDISNNDRASWDDDLNMGFVYNTGASDTIYTAIQVLRGNPNYYPINNDPDLQGNSFGIYDGFSNSEKYTSLSNGLEKTDAEFNPNSFSNDVSHTVSAGPYALGVSDSIRIAFALHAASSFEELKKSAISADTMYNFILQIPQPEVTVSPTCLGEKATLTASGGTAYNWYTSLEAENPFFQGNSYTTTALLADSVIYITNAGEARESRRKKIEISLLANPVISSNNGSTFCENDSLTLTVKEADSYLWNTGDTTQAILIKEAGEYFVTVSDEINGCTNVSDTFIVTTIPAPVADFSMALDTLPLNVGTSLAFTDLSENAIAWQWDFDNGETSDLQNPTANFVEEGAFEISLIVTDTNNCKGLVQKTLVVTGNSDHSEIEGILGYPNPVRENYHLKIDNNNTGRFDWALVNNLGKVVKSDTFFKKEFNMDQPLNLEEIPSGLYLLRISHQKKFSVLKVLKLE